MDKELLPKIAVAIQETDLPEDLKFDIIDKMENGEIENVEDLFEVLEANNVDVDLIEDLVERLESEGVSLEEDGYDRALIEELRQETGSKKKYDFGEPDLIEQYKPNKPKNGYKRPRPTPFERDY